MRVLVVNGYSSSVQGQAAFASYLSSVRKAFHSKAAQSPSTLQIETADEHTIEEYLYESSSPYHAAEAQKKFDHLDFVFIDGDSNLLPWYKKARKFLILVRMCKRTKKLLFCSGFGALMIVFLCSAKYHIERVVNGRGKGSPLEGIKTGDFTLHRGEVLLDNGTGDLYVFEAHRSCIVPIANVGFHLRKVAEENPSYKRMLKSYIYTPVQLEHNRQVVPASVNENTCRVLKKQLRH